MEIVCEMCEESSVSLLYCKECDKKMCGTCSDHHRKMKLTKDHDITELGQRQACSNEENGKGCTDKSGKEIFLCDNGKHANLELTHYCLTCNLTICCACLENEHNNHTSTEIDNAAASKRKELNELIKQLKDGDPHTVAQTSSCQTQSIAQTCATLVDNVEKQFDCFQQKILKRKQAIVDQIKELSENAIQNLKTVVEQSNESREIYEKALPDAKRLADETPLNVKFLQDSVTVFKELNKLKRKIPRMPVVQVRYNQACTSEDFERVVAALGTVIEEHGANCRTSVSDGSDDVSMSTLSSSDFHVITNDYNDLAVALNSLLESKGAPPMPLASLGRDPLQNENKAIAEQRHKLETIKTNTTTSASEPTGLTVHSAVAKGADPVPQNIKDLCKCSVRKLGTPEAVRQAVMSEDLIKVVQSRFRARKITGYWVIDGTDVVMFSKTEIMAEQCMHCLWQTLCMKHITLDAGTVDVLDSDKWLNLVKEVLNDYPNKVWITPLRKTNDIIVCSTCSAILDDVTDTLEAFLRDNQLRIIFMGYQKPIVKKILRHKKKLNNILKSYSNFRVTIEKKNDDVIQVKGVGYGLAKAVHLVHELATKMHGTGDDEDRFSDSDGSDRFSGEEESVPKVDPGVSLSMHIGDREVALHAMCFPGDDCVIYVVSGDVTKLPVEVIASPANPKLKHDGGLSKALVNSGGWSIQAECFDYAKVHGSLNPGEIFCSGAGTLPLKAIIHAVSAKWANGEQIAVEKLSEVVKSALDAATKRVTQSIAFPALGAGAYGVPVEKSTTTITDSLADFLTSHPHTGLRELYLCDMSADTAFKFASALAGKYAKADILAGSQTLQIKHVESDKKGRVMAQASPMNFLF